MSWFNQVKFFYTSTITLLITFIWTVILGLAFNQEIGFQLFFMIFIMSNLSRYLLRRGINPKVCLFVALIPIVIIEILTSSEAFLTILNIGFSGNIISKLLKEEKDDINYEEYKRVFIRGVYYMFGAGIIYGLMRGSGVRSSASIIYIGILSYSILAVITLREAMGYEYQVKRTRSSKFINYGLTLFGILLTQEFIYRKIMIFAERVKNIVGYILSWFVDIILMVLYYPIAFIFNLLQKIIGDVDNEKMAEFLKGMNGLEPNDADHVVQQGVSVNPIIILILKVLVGFIFIYILYKLVNKVYYNINKSKLQEYVESVENIDIKKTKESKLFMKIKKILRKRGTPREEIIYKYGELIDSAAKKDIFKKYMTPSQLKYVMKVKVDSSNKIDEITEIYNEAKFSEHKVGISQQNTMEENVNKLNKTMK